MSGRDLGREKEIEREIMGCSFMIMNVFVSVCVRVKMCAFGCVSTAMPNVMHVCNL